MESPRESRRVLRFGVFEADLRAGELHKHGLLKIKLQGQPFRVLALLLQRPGDLVTREELRRELWPTHTFVDFDHRLNTAINKLREALADSAENPRFVETLARRGYRFIGAVGEIDRGPRREKTATKALAVLPLENLTGDSEEEYFVDGMTDQLIATLAKIGSLQVVSRSSVMTYKGTNKTLPEIARELNVDAVVEGTVMRSGSQVRITAQLVEAETDRHMWAETYERDLRDILTLQNEIARSIAAEVQVRLTPQQEADLTSARSVNPAAYEAYLRGRYFWNKTTAAGLSTAMEYFHQAVDKEPRCALAYAGLADAYVTLGTWGFGPLTPKEALQKAKEAAAKALQISDQLAEAHTALAQVRFYHEWNFARAEREYQQALQLNPNSSTGHLYYSIYLVAMGRADESLFEMQRACTLDPLSLLVNAMAGWRFYLARQFDAAIEQLRNTREMDPNFAPTRLFLGLAYEQATKCEEAIVEFKKALSLSQECPLVATALGHAYALAGRTREARKLLGNLEDSSKGGCVAGYHVAAIYAALGDNDRVFECLEKAYEDRSLWMAHLRVMPRLDPLRSDPRFQDLLRRMNFPP